MSDRTVNTFRKPHCVLSPFLGPLFYCAFFLFPSLNLVHIYIASSYGLALRYRYLDPSLFSKMSAHLAYRRHLTVAEYVLHQHKLVTQSGLRAFRVGSLFSGLTKAQKTDSLVSIGFAESYCFVRVPDLARLLIVFLVLQKQRRDPYRQDGRGYRRLGRCRALLQQFLRRRRPLRVSAHLSVFCRQCYYDEKRQRVESWISFDTSTHVHAYGLTWNVAREIV